ncbi:hypothetical protein EYF80_005211 [Liparis tanakae]|uniref:Uncharacterized protein n=1 Tax=Liparis tanakae TaxID=230148 RepID=A0A4Z2J3J6_9TELE|nr:hypothetical protein EYF80_005211 [Liparis tanakae]
MEYSSTDSHPNAFSKIGEKMLFVLWYKCSQLKLDLIGEVADVNGLSISQVVVAVAVEQVLVLVQPDLCHPRQTLSSSGSSQPTLHSMWESRKNDLREEVWGRSVEHAVHGAEERGPNFIHEAEDHTGGRQVIVDQMLCTPKS